MSALVVLAHMAVHDHTTPVGGSESIARERMHGKLESLLLCVVFREADILRGEQRFRRHVVGIHTFPSARNGTTMEHHLKSILIGIDEDVFVEFHHLLFVAAEEVNLYSCDIVVLHPFHLAMTSIGCIHTVARSLRSIVPVSVRAIPQHESHALALSISRQLLDAFASYLCVPPVIDKAVFKAHLSREVDKLRLIVVVD